MRWVGAYTAHTNRPPPLTPTSTPAVLVRFGETVGARTIARPCVAGERIGRVFHRSALQNPLHDYRPLRHADVVSASPRRSAGCAGRPPPGPRSWWRRRRDRES